jgi:hypothetical protein
MRPAGAPPTVMSKKTRGFAIVAGIGGGGGG